MLNNSDATLVITNAAFADILTPLKPDLPAIAAEQYILTDGADVPGYRSYHALTASASDQNPPPIEISRDDAYNIIYSSGTTGLPKGIAKALREWIN